MSAHGDYDMGHTVAGWTGTAMASAGFTVCGLGMVTGSLVPLVGGVVIVVLAVLTTCEIELS
ncbi:HGxxPAAW family protein, partial [Streptomyces sp. NPDC058964]|uniref:HGxxPAAW family protein n=1 Tax=Streptomyces sp. NPDC058964 TaxID=3346681 RepID=UPI0036A7E1F8